MPSDDTNNSNNLNTGNEDLSMPQTPVSPSDSKYVEPEHLTSSEATALHVHDNTPHLGHSVTKKSVEEEIEDDEEDDEDEKEPQVVREVIIKEKRVRSGGCFDFIKDVTCFVVLAIIALIAATIAIVIFKPSFIVEPLKTFINGPYVSGSAPKEQTPAAIEDAIQQATEGKHGDVTFQVSEDQLSSLVKQRTEGGNDIRAQVEDKKFIILTNISDTGNPLWFVVEFTDTGENVELTHLGLGRLNTPEFLRTFLKGQLLKIFGSFSEDLKVQTSEELANSLLNKFLGADAKIRDVTFQKDVILVTVTL